MTKIIKPNPGKNPTIKLNQVIAAMNRNRKNLSITIILIACSINILFFVSNDAIFYHRPIAKILSINHNAEAQTKTTDESAGNTFHQEMEAILLNSAHIHEKIQLLNTYSFSQAVDSRYNINDEVFLTLKENAAGKIVSAEIIDVKRDIFLAIALILFALLILLIGRLKGLRTLASMAVNITILIAVIWLYQLGFNLIIISLAASPFFIVLSILIVSGINKKTAAAIIGAIAGTIISMGIAVAVLLANHSKGVHYEEMEFLTHLPEQIFMAEVLIGTLGGIMDITISISSAIYEMYLKNPAIEQKALIQSGMEIGKDIMGTMANTMLLAYISGSIPIILLWLKNGFSTFTIINFKVSLEIIRALTGGIGIVVSIPITLYVSVLLLRKKRMEEI